MGQQVPIERGVSPPSNTNVLWLDTSVAGSRVDPSPASRKPRFPVTQTYQSGVHQECSLMFDPVRLYWAAIYNSGGSNIAWAQSVDPLSDDPEAWVHGATAINLGAYYWHQNATVHNGTIYCIGSNNAGSLKLFTAPLPAFGAMPVFTDQGVILSGVPNTLGNNGLAILPDGRIVLYVEVLADDWRTGYYTATEIAGPYAFQSALLEDLSPTRGAGYGGVWPVVENNGITLLYHSSLGGAGFGCRARTRFDGFAQLGSYVRDNDIGVPYISCAHPLEKDQVADLSTAFDHNGNGLICWTAISNLGGTFTIMMDALQPVLRWFLHGAWVPVHAASNPFARLAWVEPTFVQNADATVQHGEQVIFINGAANHSAFLPRAGRNSRVKPVVADYLTNTVTPVALSGDTIAPSAAGPIAAFTTRTMACYSDGTWQLE